VEGVVAPEEDVAAVAADLLAAVRAAPEVAPVAQQMEAAVAAASHAPGALVADPGPPDVKTPGTHLKIQPITFTDILRVWETELWPGRKSTIEPSSAINANGEIDLALLDSPSFFWQAVNPHGDVLGVISGQQGDGWMRSRGLWVSPSCRRLGVGRRLIDEVIEHARAANLRRVWTMARSTSLGFYTEMGFRITRQIDGYEFGPHHLAELQLREPSKPVS